MRGESANEMNIYEYFQSFVSSGPFRRAENPFAAQNCIVVIVVVKKKSVIQTFFSTTVHALMPLFRNSEHYYGKRYKRCRFMSKTRYSTLGRQNNLHSN